MFWINEKIFVLHINRSGYALANSHKRGAGLGRKKRKMF